MTIAFDIGAHRIRSLRREGNRLLARSCRSLYAVLPDDELQQRLLQQIGVPFAACDGGLILMSDVAVEYARLFRSVPVPLLPGGRVPLDDPPARQVLASLVETVLPRPARPGELCILTAPGRDGSQPAATRPASRDPEIDFLTRLLRLRGYAPAVISAGMGVVLAELVDRGFTGIGISFGAAYSEAVLAHRGVEIARCAVPHAGNWIDDRLARITEEYAWDAAGNRYLDCTAIARWKESWTGSIVEPASHRESLLAQLYEGLIAHVLRKAAEEFSARRDVVKALGPLAVVVCGGTARVRGFGELFERVLRAADFPLGIESVRVAVDSDYTIARGCLIQAELEDESALLAA